MFPMIPDLYKFYALKDGINMMMRESRDGDKKVLVVEICFCLELVVTLK